MENNVKGKVVVFGSSGVGKSTFLNKVLPEEAVKFNVSDDRDVDGTLRMICRDGFLDTPGLDSVNASEMPSTSLAQNLEDEFAIVLVVSHQQRRITNWSTKLKDLLNDLCGTGPKILVVWTFCSAVDPSAKASVDRTFPGKIDSHICVEAENFKQLFHAFCAKKCARLRTPEPPKAVPSGPPTTVLKSSPSIATSQPSVKGKSSKVTAHPENTPVIKAIFTKNILATTTGKLPKARAQALCKEVMKLHAVTDVRLSDSLHTRYRDFKMIGDALLRLVVYIMLRAEGKDLTECSEPICKNDGCMSKLYDDWVLEGPQGSPGEPICDHTKADVIEAMMGYCLYHAPVDLPMIISALRALAPPSKPALSPAPVHKLSG